MRNCMKADLIRVQKKKSFILMAVITLVIFLGAFLLSKFLPGKDGFSAAFSMYMGMGTGTFSLLMGIPVFLAVYSDDFKSKAMQTAIGFGVSRTKLIICRFLEIIALLVECAAVFSIVVMILGLAGGGDWSAIGGVLKSLWLDVYTSLCYCSIAIIIVYIMQNATFALVVYIFLAAGLISGVLNILNLIPFLSDNKIDLSVITVGHMISEGQKSGKLYMMFLPLIIYILIPVAISSVVFKKKELEF